MRLALLGAAFFAFTPINAALAQQEDTQIWTSAIFASNLGEGRSFSLEAQTRFVGDASELGQYSLRPSFSFRLNEAQSAGVGYAYIATERGNAPTDREHRLWQQFSHTWERETWELQARTRLEERFVETNDDIGLRLRQLFRVTIPQTETRSLVISTEPFITFNDTDWGQESGLDQWRNSVSFNIDLSSKVSIDVGYLNQYDVRSGEDRMNHILNFAITSRW